MYYFTHYKFKNKRYIIFNNRDKDNISTRWPTDIITYCGRSSQNIVNTLSNKRHKHPNEKLRRNTTV